MKFSLFYEMQISGPDGASESQTFRNCVEQAVLADKLGYHCIWAVEHHGLYEYSHSSAPEVFLSFVAAKTERIRIGHGVSLTPGKFNHPIRIAERVATLDILSGGRVSWGSGKSSSNVEADLFGIDKGDLHSQWEEALEMVPRMWTEDVFSWQGTHYNIPPAHIVPKPVQRPHPPLFGASSRIESLMKLGTMGIGALNFSMSSYNDLKQHVRVYKNLAKNANPVHWQRNNHFAVTANTCILENDDEACFHGIRGARYFKDTLKLYYNGDRPPLGSLQVNRSELSSLAIELTKQFRLNEDTQLLSIVGDPSIAIEKVKMFQDAGVDELILIMQLGTVPHEITMRSLQCFAEQVMPCFPDNDNETTIPALQEDKEEELDMAGVSSRKRRFL
jgi:alkanesulfonate monooxygenase SsuD/methylene tetrahydromethanopterin reductase-like flavin-dependent oxidoreductase (luciferase family)